MRCLSCGGSCYEGALCPDRDKSLFEEPIYWIEVHKYWKLLFEIAKLRKYDER
jgi:hypothetical protein